MGAFTVLSTHHTSFTVSNLDRSLVFFRDVLGFPVIHSEHADQKLASGLAGIPDADVKLAFVQAPGHSIELVEYLGPADRKQVSARTCDSGAAHIALVVDDLDGAMDAARRAGLALVGEAVTVREGAAAGARAVYMRDPDGIQIEFIQMPRKAS